MRSAKRSVRLRLRRALSVLVLSICLLLNSHLPAAFAQHSLNDYHRADQSDDAVSQGVSRPRRIDPDRQYDDDGPTVRVALVTDVTDVPISSSQRATGFVKKVVRKLIIFYSRYTGQQVTLLGQSVVRLGEAVTQRVEQLEGRVEDLARLTERVERLEAELRTRQP